MAEGGNPVVEVSNGDNKNNETVELTEKQLKKAAKKEAKKAKFQKKIEEQKQAVANNEVHTSVM